MSYLSVLVEIALYAAAGLFAVPVLTVLAQCLLALRPLPRKPEFSGARPALAVLMPAHDEEAVITETLRAVLPELDAADRLYVIADNCRDRTAELARAAGAHVLERSDATHRGKGYALAYGLEQLVSSAPELVVILDADCRVSKGALDHIGRLALHAGRPVQADYLLVAPSGATPRTRVSAFAFLVRNRVRPRGFWQLGLPCQLTGSGMAFPWGIIRAASAMDANIVEDLAMGLDLALKGFAPLYTPWAEVTSLLPTSSDTARKQRRRWESGQLTTLTELAPRLLAQGIRRRNAELVALGLDLIVPPLALLVGMLTGLCALSWAGYLILGTGGIPATLLLLEFGMLSVGLIAAWLKYGRTTVSARDLLMIPAYLLWKLPLYVSLAVRGREKSWTRTEREPPKAS